MSANEQLGIELKITDSTAVNTMDKLLATIKGIQEALKGLNTDSLQKTMTGLSGASTGVTGTATAVDNLAKYLQNLGKTTSSVDAIIKVMDAAKKSISATASEAEKLNHLKMNKMDWNDFQKANKKLPEELKLVGEDIGKVYRKIKADTETTMKSLEVSIYNSMSKVRASASNLNDGSKVSFSSYAGKDADGHIKLRNKVILDGEVALGNSILAINKNTNNALRLESLKAAQERREALATAFRGMGNVSASQASEEVQKLGINLKNLRGTTELSKLSSMMRDFGLSINRTTGEISALKKGVEQVKSGFFSFLPDTLGRMATRLAEFYSIRTVLFAVTSQFRDATKAAIDLNQGVHDILAISGESKSQFGAISDSIYDIAKNSRFTTQEVIGLMQVLAQAGVAANNLGAVSAETGRFATATASAPKEAADLVTTAMNVYDIDATKVTRITNAMTAALNLSKLETNGLATAFSYLAPQASQLGMSMEQTLGIVANMAQSGIKPSTIGTGVSQMLKEFAAPKPRLRKMLEVYGIDEQSINPMKHDFADIVQTLQTAKVSVSDLFAAMESRVGRSAVTAINLSAESFREMTANLSGTSAALLAYDKTMEGARARINVVKQSFGELATKIGESLAPSLIVLTEILKGAFIVLGTGDGIISKIVIGLAALAAAVYPVIAAARALTAAATATSGAGLLSMFSFGPVVAGITIAVAAIGGLLYALNSVNRAKEEAKKVELEQIDRGERLDRSLNAIIHSTKETSAAYTEYQKALKEGKTVSEALELMDNRYITIKSDQKAALQKYIAEGGPHSEYLRSLMKEKGLLSAIIELQNLRTTDKNEKLLSDMEKYNAKVNELYRTQDARSSRNTGGGDSPVWTNQLSLADVQAQDKKTIAELQSGLQGTTINSALGPIKDANFDEKGIGRWDKIIPPEPKNTKRLAGGTTTEAAKMESWAFKHRQFMDEMAKKSADDLIRANELIIKDAEKSYATRTAALEKLLAQTELKENAATAKLVSARLKAYADGHKGVKYNAKTDSLLNANTNSSDYAGLQGEIAAIKGEGAKSLANAKAEAIKAKLDVDTQLEKKFTDDIKKLKEDSAKASYDLEMKLADDTLKSSLSSIEDKKAAFTASKLAIEKKYLAEFKEEKDKLELEFLATDMSDEGKLNNGISLAESKANDKRDKDLASLVNKVISSPVKSNSAKREKEIGYELKTAASTASAQKDQAWTGAEVTQVELDLLGKQIRAEKEKQELWNNDKRLLSEKHDLALEAMLSTTHTQLELDTLNADYINSLSDVNEKLREGADLLKEQAKQAKEIADTSFLGNFTTGIRSAFRSQDNFKGQTSQLGSDITNTGINGVSDSIYSAFNPDKQKIAETKQKIIDLQVQKAELEGTINASSLNSNRTVEETNSLNEKKIALEGINSSLKEQQDSLSKQTNAWQSFADGLKKVMTQILEELQKYIIKLLVVAMVKQIAGFFTSSAAPSTLATNATDTVNPLSMNNILGKADGGMIPLGMGTAGVDSVPAMLMPGEVVIKKSSVDYYGASKLLDINDRKVQKFASGGLVGGGSSSGGFDSEKPYEIHIYNIADPTSIPRQAADANEILNIVSYDAANRGVMHKVIKGVMSR